MHKLTCRACGVVFEFGRKKAYCSIACRKLNRRARVKRISPIPRACAVCAKVFTPGGGQWQARFCTAKCRDAAPRGEHCICDWCGGQFQQYRPSKPQKYCSPKCASAAKSAAALSAKPKQAATHRSCRYCSNAVSRRGMCCHECRARLTASAITRKCKNCGRGYVRVDTAIRRSLFCSDECRVESALTARRRARKKERAQFRRTDLYRARRAGVAYEPVNRLFVFARDKWRCQLCGCGTPKSLKGKNQPRSPELDHIVPLAMGGPHTYANVQCACRKCNAKKGGYRAMGQMPLLSGGVF